MRMWITWSRGTNLRQWRSRRRPWIGRENWQSFSADPTLNASTRPLKDSGQNTMASSTPANFSMNLTRSFPLMLIGHLLLQQSWLESNWPSSSLACSSGKNVPANKKPQLRLHRLLRCRCLTSTQGPSPTRCPSTRPPSQTRPSQFPSTFHRETPRWKGEILGQYMKQDYQRIQ